MRILVIEDSDIVAEAVTRVLVDAHFVVDRVTNAETALALIGAEAFSLAIVDIGLPGIDGLTLVRRLRKAGKTIPTLILTARDTLSDKVKALDLGADDFLSKPFEPAELVARCHALIRRANTALNGIINLSRVMIDLAGRRLKVDGNEVDITAREWMVLECLTLHIGRVVPKESLLQTIANLEEDISPNAVEVHVSRLRAKLGDSLVIRGLRGLGYRLEEVKPQ